ncbi:Radial spoke head protein 9 [Trebouxia sp. C0009 RCD-2024]
MVLQPHLTLTLEALGSSGVVLPLEQKAILAHSLPIKQAKAGLRNLTLWGKVTARNGKDYLIAQGMGKLMPGQLLRTALKYSFSQDGVKWVDLEALSDEVASKAAGITGMLSGEPAKAYTVQVPGAAPVAEEEEAAEGAPAGSQVSELQRLRSIVDVISADTSVVPKGSLRLDASGQVVPNDGFQGVAYPDKLESYIHGMDGPEGVCLAKDIQGMWALQYDSFQGLISMRSLIWPGYQFYYSTATRAWGSLYSGNGCKNNDLVFML